MNEVWLLSVLAFALFGAAYYQSYINRSKWKRVIERKSSSTREELPPLIFEGKEFEPNRSRVIVVWGDSSHTGFPTTLDAKKAIEQSRKKSKSSPAPAHIFAWNGEMWIQR